MTIAVLHHLVTPFLGHAVALGAGGDLLEYDLRRGDGLPDLDDVAGIVSLGGEQSSWEPELQPEVALLRAAVDRDVPVLGVCLGAQLLARALGAEVRRTERYVGWRALNKLPAGAADPLLGDLVAPVPALHFNQDVFDLPPGAEELLARIDPHSVEAFRAGRAWGIQYHPDADRGGLEGWITDYAEQMSDVRALRAGYGAAHEAASRGLFAAFGRLVRDE